MRSRSGRDLRCGSLPVEHLAEHGRELGRLAGLTVLAPEEAAVPTGEDDRLTAQTRRAGSPAAMRQLSVRLLAHGDDDARRGRPERLEVRLVVRIRDEVLAEQDVIA